MNFINNFLYDKDWSKRQAVIKCFPFSLKEDAIIIASLIKFNDYSVHNKIQVSVDNENFIIPYRVYFNKISTWKIQSLSDQQKIMLACLYSRHHDWYIREEMLRKLSWSNKNFTIPYVVQLLSEYVIELFPIIDAQINENNIEEYHKYYKANQIYFKKVEKRIMSYWNVYYDYNKTYKKNNYIWFQILNRIKFYWTNKS